MAIAIVYTIGQYFLLEFVKARSADLRNKKKLHLDKVHKLVTIVQYGLTVVIGFTTLQIILMSNYSVLLIDTIIWISYLVAIVMMGLLAYRFFSWFRSNRNSVVLLYGLASATLSINAVFTLGFVTDLFQRLPSRIPEHQGFGYAPFISPGSITDILNNAYVISSIVSFILWWGATALLLHYYSQRVGNVKYWIILGIPLVYFLMQFIPFFPILFSLFPNSANIFFIYTIIFTLSKPAGGILFGIAFWILARSLNPDNVVRNYMIISAFGLVLLFFSNQAVVLVSVPYPPFGLATVSFLGLSSYLILVGVYASAISVSEDSKLRQTIRHVALKESTMLDSIGTAQMQQQIEKRVLSLTNRFSDQLQEKSGIQSSLEEQEMKDYVNQVLEEIKARKLKDDNSNHKSNNI